MTIAVLGAGAWGTALAITLAVNSPENQFYLWGRNHYYNKNIHFKLPINLMFTTNLIDVVQKYKDLIIAVPSNGFVDLIEKIKPYLTDHHNIAWATKGMDADSNKFFSDIIVDFLGENLPIAILSGPSFAQEVVERIPTVIILAFKVQHQKFADRLFDKLHSNFFKIVFSNDLVGVQLGGIFKNVLAVAAGICDGIGFGANTKSALITLGINELLRLAEKLTVNINTIIGLSGIGDILLTCCNTQSRNFKFGMLLGKGINVAQAKIEIGQEIESLNNIQSLYKLSINYKVNMPIVTTVWEILSNRLPIEQAINFLLPD